MARKPAAAAAPAPVAKKKARKRTKPRAAGPAPAASRAAAGMPDLSSMAHLMTPEQAIELYKANARLALDVINAAIESTARVRKLQFDGEEQARDFQKKTARSAATASDAQSLMAVGQGAAQEAMERSMRYWGEMFELITEIQKRVFVMIEQQTEDMPGVKQAKAAMSMMPDMKALTNVVEAMQGVVGAGGNSFGQLQKMMGDLARYAQSSVPGGRR